MNNQVLDAIRERSSIRAYKDEALSDEEILVLKEAALQSPTARNLQAQRFFFITNKDVIDDVDRCVARAINGGVLPENYRKTCYGAPLLIVIGIAKGSHYGLVDCGIASQSIALAAKSIGLDTVILGMPEHAFELGPEAPRMRKIIGMGDELEYGVAVAVGRKAADKAPHSYDMSHCIDIK